jgi:hypothetical protein
MRTVGSLMMALSALALFAGVGCSTDGYTPKCTDVDGYSDCLPGPEGGTWLDSGTDTSSQPDTAVDQGVQQEVEPETGPEADTTADALLNE